MTTADVGNRLVSQPQLLTISFETEGNDPILWFQRQLGNLTFFYELAGLRSQIFRQYSVRGETPTRAQQSEFQEQIYRIRLLSLEHGSPASVETFLYVKEMNYGSPWQLALSSAAQASMYAGVGGIAYGALRGLRTLLSLKMEWDKHRADMDVAREELSNLRLNHAFAAVREFNETLSVPDWAADDLNTGGLREEVLARKVADFPDIRHAEIAPQGDRRRQ